MQSRDYISYAIRGPIMNKSVPSTQCPAGTMGDVWGCDGRFMNCLHKFYGMKEVLDLDTVIGDIDAYDGPSFVKHVVFQKRGTSSFYRGFVVRWDSDDDNDNEQVDLIYTLDNGGTWAQKTLWTGGTSGITNTVEMDCETDRGYLFVCIEGKSPKTVYWDGSALQAVNMGPGAFTAELGALQDNGVQSTDTDYHLRGNGVFQVAWRFYDSKRGIYSAMSSVLTVYMDIMKTTKATGSVYFNSAGGDSGLFVDGDTITINGRVYEADNDSSITGDVAINITGLTTILEHAQALADAINGDSQADVTAKAQTASVLLEAKARGSDANAYGISKSETGSNTDDISVSGSTLTGGGEATEDPEEQCKVVLDFPDNTAVVADKAYADFDALFDTVQVFRSIDIGSGALGQTGALLFLEQEISETGNWATSGAWDSLQVSLGKIPDDALPFQTMYDAERDIVTAPPQSGTICRYQGLTFMADAQSSSNPYDILHSSAEHISAEYFSTYNRRRGTNEEGRAIRLVPAGDSLFVLKTNSVLYAYKSARGKPIQYQELHRGRGLTGKQAAHAVGNSLFMIVGSTLVMLNASDGNMGQVSTADRLLSDDWVSDLDDVWSCYDAGLNASFFLNPSANEVLIIWHSSHVVNMLKGANFVACTQGPDISDGKKTRGYFITATGLIVSPDLDESGSGTMWGLDSSYTLNGTATSAGSTLVDSNATFHADMVGTLVYMTGGDNAGLAREISNVDVGAHTISFVSGFPNSIAVGDTYAISPVPVGVRLWPIRDPDAPQDEFRRTLVTSVGIEVQKTSGFTNNVNDFWRVGAYRNGGSSVESGTNATDTVDIDENPADSWGYISVDGIKVEPYIEQISCGVSFELTNVEVGVTMSSSRNAV